VLCKNGHFNTCDIATSLAQHYVDASNTTRLFEEEEEEEGGGRRGERKKDYIHPALRVIENNGSCFEEVAASVQLNTCGKTLSVLQSRETLWRLFLSGRISNES
jgi:hypothetical protein